MDWRSLSLALARRTWLELSVIVFEVHALRLLFTVVAPIFSQYGLEVLSKEQRKSFHKHDLINYGSSGSRTLSSKTTNQKYL